MTNPYASTGAPLREPPLTPEQRARRLPFSGWLPVGVGALVGILLRLAFYGDPGERYASMLMSFIVGSPLVVGVVTVYVAELEERRSWAFYFFASALATLLYVVGTLAILIEGWICAIVIIPLFAIIGGLGGVLMGVVCRATNWPRGRIVIGVVLLMLAGGAVEDYLPTANLERVQQRELWVAAPPDRVWRELVDVRDIGAGEVDGWMYRIGVPPPRAAAGEARDGQHLRHVTMGKGIRFDQVATEWRENERVSWRYRFDADSFPPGALDDHVRIGGEYFDLGETTYELRPEGNGTRLSIRMRYRVSTHFNWYAAPVADFLVGDFSEQILGFYALRAQRPATSRR